MGSTVIAVFLKIDALESYLTFSLLHKGIEAEIHCISADAIFQDIGSLSLYQSQTPIYKIMKS